MDYRTEAPPVLRDFLVYHETIQGHSRRTVDEYYLDLRNFFRFLKQSKHLVSPDVPMDNISIDDADLALVRDVTLTDIYSYMNYLSRDRGLNNTSRARKVATIRSFYKYLTNKAKLLETNPVQDLDSPRLKKSLPKYLNLEESMDLLDSVDGKNAVRDYCILTLFLNCGLRISELVGLNKTDIRGDQLRVLGKGNKERMLYLNDACQRSLEDWLTQRDVIAPAHLHSGGSQAGEEAPVRRRTGQHAVLLPQAAPHRRHPDAAKRRGCAHTPGGAGPRPFEHHSDLHPCGQRGPAHRRQSQPAGACQTEKKA